MAKYKDVLSLSADAAKRLFLRSDRYCNFPLPYYFSFKPLLKALDTFLLKYSMGDWYDKGKYAQSEHINHCIYANKDGKYNWRPFQLIHPVLYVHLVHEICNPTAWREIQNLFKHFKSNHLECASLPLIHKNYRKTRTSETIFNWLERVERGSLAKALEYSFILTTDISDFYPSIYTHSIAWAIHTKKIAQKSCRGKNESEFLGGRIDKIIRLMQHEQTNGLPQGSDLSDFIAEIILGYADYQLISHLPEDLTDYYIIRYRDDYRIFVNNPLDGEIILKTLTEVLLDMGLKLNPSKTKASNDILSTALKPDKLQWVSTLSFVELIPERQQKKVKKLRFRNNQTTLLGIYQLSKNFPNSGTLDKLLGWYHEHLILKKNEDVKVLISILTGILYENPKVYPRSMAILSYLLEHVKDKDEQLKILNCVQDKLRKKPNIEMLDIWLQRISWKIDPNKQYKASLCRVMTGELECPWDNRWLKMKKLKGIFIKNSIVNAKAVKRMTQKILPAEVDMFVEKYP